MDEKAKAAPGTYFLGDPCHVVAEEEWREFMACWRTGREWHGKPIIAFRTMTGDGSYRDQERHGYGVDSGMIGLVPVENIGRELLPGNGRMVELVAETNCAGCDQRGTMKFGKIRIKTG